MLSLADQIRRRVESRDALELFSSKAVTKKGDSQLAVAKELSRLEGRGELIRARRGIYYKPKESRFGALKPSESDILKFLLFEKGKRVGYVSGFRLYNRLGLTSQVSGVIEIATNQIKRSGNLMGLRVRYVKAYGDVKKDDVQLLELLDVLKDSNLIPDSDQYSIIQMMLKQIRKLPSDKHIEMARIALKYPPRVKAIVGALISHLNPKQSIPVISSLRSQLPNTSHYAFKQIDHLLPNAASWKLNGTAS